MCGELLYNLRFERILRLAHMYDDDTNHSIFNMAASRRSRVSDELTYVSLASIENEQGIDCLIVCGTPLSTSPSTTLMLFYEQILELYALTKNWS